MAIPVTCTCGNKFDLRDEFAGKQVRCPRCDNVLVAERRAPAITVDPAFDHDKFLLKQQVLTVQQRYEISDEHGKLLVFAERPYHHLRGFLSLGIFIVTLMGGLFISTVIVGLVFGMEPGTPVMYRGQQVGQVISVGLAHDSASVDARAYIQPEYRDLVRDNLAAHFAGRPLVTPVV